MQFLRVFCKAPEKRPAVQASCHILAKDCHECGNAVCSLEVSDLKLSFICWIVVQAYKVQYPAPGDSDLAHDLIDLLR